MDVQTRPGHSAQAPVTNAFPTREKHNAPSGWKYPLERDGTRERIIIELANVFRLMCHVQARF